MNNGMNYDLLLSALDKAENGPVLDEKDWDRIMAVNLKSVFLVSKATMPFMKQQKWGRIINIGSSHDLDETFILQRINRFILDMEGKVLWRL